MIIIEEVLIIIGQLSCLFAAIFVAARIDQRIGTLFVLAFVMVFQSYYMTVFVELPDTFAEECISSATDFYNCLPIEQKISAHSAQAGQILIGLGIFLLARRSLGNS